MYKHKGLGGGGKLLSPGKFSGLGDTRIED